MSSRRILRFFRVVFLPLFLAIGFAVVGRETEDPLLIRARELRLNEVYLESARLYRAHIAENPEDSAARMELAELLLQLDEPAEAANQMIPVLAEDPEDTRAREMFDESLRRVEESVDAAGDGTLLPQIARLHRFSGDGDRARDFYGRYLDVNPEDPLALHELAQMAYDEGDAAEGLARLEEAIAAAEEDGEVRRELLLKRAVWISFDPDRQEEAAAAFEALLEEYPGLAEGYIRLGDLYRFRGDYEEAGRAYAEGVRIGGPDERAAEGYYQVLLRTRALERAREARLEGDLDGALRYFDLHFVEMEKTRERLAELEDREDGGRMTAGQRRAAEFFRRFIDEVRSNDFFGQAVYRTPGDDAPRRWQFEGSGETGWFSDGNYRSRAIGTVLNRTIEDGTNALKLGFRGLYLDYSEDSFSFWLSLLSRSGCSWRERTTIGRNGCPPGLFCSSSGSSRSWSCGCSSSRFS